MSSTQRNLVEVEPRDEFTIVRLHAKTFDSANFPDVARTLYNLVDKQGCQSIILNLGDIEFLFSESVGLLVSLNKRLKNDDVSFRLTNLRDSVIEILKVTQLLDLFEIDDS